MKNLQLKPPAVVTLNLPASLRSLRSKTRTFLPTKSVRLVFYKLQWRLRTARLQCSSSSRRTLLMPQSSRLNSTKRVPHHRKNPRNGWPSCSHRLRKFRS